MLVLRTISVSNQALNVTFTCNAKRGKCKFVANFFNFKSVLEFCVKPTLVRPFSNKRYNSKFSPSLQHPLRKMSMNRLKQL